MLTVQEQYSLRTNYYTPEINPIMAVATVMASLVVNTKYKDGNYVLDVSSYQDKVDFKTIRTKAPWILGAYCKLGEVGDKGYGIEDGWKDWTFSQCIQDLADNHMWAGAYMFINTAWFGPQNQIDLGDYQSWDDIQDETIKFIKLIQNDPHVRLLLRQILIGFENLGSVYKFTAETVAKVKKLSMKRIHALFLDVERYWKWYPISSGATLNGRVDGIWMAEVTDRTAKRWKWLMDHLFIPKQLPIILYSADWVITNYAEQMRTKADFYDTACAGYYYSGGYVQTTWDEMKNTYLAGIPNTWKPRLFGGAEVYGKKVWFYQNVADRFACAEIQNNMGAWSPFDLNYINGTFDQFIVKFDAWTDWKELGTNAPPVDPPVDPPIPPVITTASYVTVTSTKLNARKDAGTANALIDSFVLSGFSSKLVEEKTISNGEKWAHIKIDAWICEGQNGVSYVKIEQK